MIAPERFPISLVGSKYDNHPRRSLVTWADLVNLLTKPRRTECTLATCGTGIHAELDRDGKAIGCRHKNGPGWIPATFSTGRKKTAVEQVSLLVVDGDHMADVAALQATLTKLERYRYVAHATHGDRADDRYARIALPLSMSVPGEDWQRFWPAVMAALGMPSDPSCCDAGRLYYLPARPSDADFWFEVHNGEAIDVATIIASAPEVAPAVARSLDMDESGKVGAGKRHAMLKSLAGSMRHRGAGAVEIEAALLLANQHRCDPPKSEAEVKEIAAWAAAQPVSSLPPWVPSYEPTGHGVPPERGSAGPSASGVAREPGGRRSRRALGARIGRSGNVWRGRRGGRSWRVLAAAARAWRVARGGQPALFEIHCQMPGVGFRGGSLTGGGAILVPPSTCSSCVGVNSRTVVRTSSNPSFRCLSFMLVRFMRASPFDWLFVTIVSSEPGRPASGLDRVSAGHERSPQRVKSFLRRRRPADLLRPPRGARAWRILARRRRREHVEELGAGGIELAL